MWLLRAVDKLICEEGNEVTRNSAGHCVIIETFSNITIYEKLPLSLTGSQKMVLHSSVVDIVGASLLQVMKINAVFLCGWNHNC